MNKDCEIINDLLPNYIEGLTSTTTNEFIKEHIEKCNYCKEKFLDMSDNIEKKQEEKKEINYFKKLNKMIVYKALKIGISLGLLIVLIIYLIIVLYRYNILNSATNKFETYKYSTNFYAEENLMIMENDNSFASFVKTKYWFKDNILKIEYESTRFPETNNNTTIFDYNKNKLYVMNNKEKIVNITNEIPTGNAYNNPEELLYTLIGNKYKYDKEILKTALNIWYHPAIYTTNENYVIEGIKIDKETGLYKSSMEYVYTGNEGKDNVYYHWFSYDFNTLSNEDIYFDISEYNTVDYQIYNIF